MTETALATALAREQAYDAYLTGKAWFRLVAFQEHCASGLSEEESAFLAFSRSKGATKRWRNSYARDPSKRPDPARLD